MNDTTFAELREALGRYRVANFKGLGVLDFRSRRPTFYTIVGGMSIYKTEFRFLVRLRQLKYKTMLDNLAQAECNAAARLASVDG